MTIGDRFKRHENSFKFHLPPRHYFVLRIDGKAFHTFTRGMRKPFCKKLTEAFQKSTIEVIPQIQGFDFAYGQSDEVSFVFSDLTNLNSDIWFGGGVQKIASIGASLFTGHFNRILGNEKLAFFDARVFALPNKAEVVNYLIWRQQDATRNSIQAVAQSLYSHKELQGKNSGELQELIFQKGINWNDLETWKKRGWGIVKEGRDFKVVDLPIFTEDREFFEGILTEE